MGHGKLCFQPCSLMSMVCFHPWPEDANQDLSGAQKEKKQPGVRHDSCGPAFILCDNFVFLLLENWLQPLLARGGFHSGAAGISACATRKIWERVSMKQSWGTQSTCIKRRVHLGALAAVLYVILEGWSQKCANTIYFLTKKKLLINDIVRSLMRDPCRLTDVLSKFNKNMNSKKSEELLLCICQTRRSKHTIWTKEWLLSIPSKLAHSVSQKKECWFWGTSWALGSVF